MALGLKRFHSSGCTHFITFSCYHRQPFLSSPSSARHFEKLLESIRRSYQIRIYGYVVMPEHVHLLLSEPSRSELSIAMQMLKQLVSKKLRDPNSRRFWQVRYYDFLVKDDATRIEKLRYIHRNPVKRGLCKLPEDWLWSSFQHHATGLEGTVEIESRWTARKRELRTSPTP
jgi:putative transposase